MLRHDHRSTLRLVGAVTVQLALKCFLLIYLSIYSPAETFGVSEAQNCFANIYYSLLGGFIVSIETGAHIPALEQLPDNEVKPKHGGKCKRVGLDVEMQRHGECKPKGNTYYFYYTQRPVTICLRNFNVCLKERMPND